MSFHGVPERTLQLGDPYHCECHKTARMLAARLRPGEGAVHGRLPVALRQGEMAGALHRADPARAGAARRGAGGCGLPRLHRRLPGDAGRNRAGRPRRPSLTSGGKAFHYIPCLNDDPAWIAALGAWRSGTWRAGRPAKRPIPKAQARSRAARRGDGSVRGNGCHGSVAAGFAAAERLRRHGVVLLDERRHQFELLRHIQRRRMPAAGNLDHARRARASPGPRASFPRSHRAAPGRIRRRAGTAPAPAIAS